MAAMALSSVGAFAQYEGGEFTIQPKIGFNAAMLTNLGEDADGGVRGGLVIGAEAEYHVSKVLGISAGALYSQQGSEITITRSVGSTSSETKTTRKVDYINIPILANIYVAKGLALKVGVQPGFNVHSSYDVDKNTSTSVGSASTSSSREMDIEKFDFSIPMGISYEFGGGFCFDGRYNLGLTKLNKAGDGDKDVKNSVIQLTFGYKFKL